MKSTADYAEKREYGSLKKRAEGSRTAKSRLFEFPPEAIGMIIFVGILVAIGLIMTFSASFPKSIKDFSTPFALLLKQIFSLGIALVLGFLAFLFSSKFNLKSVSVLIWLIAFTFLIATFVPGIGVHKKGSARWIDFGPIGLQPSELLKIATVLLVSRFVADYIEKKEKIYLLVGSFILMTSALAVGLQKDLTTAAIIFAAGFTAMLISRIEGKYIILILAIALLLGIIGIFVEGYRMTRIQVLIDPWNAPRDAGQQVSISLAALSKGGITGVGLGMSNLKYNKLPEAYTDFIFAVLGSETGLIGSLSVLILYFFFFFLGFRLTNKIKNLYARLVSTSLVALFAYQTIINVGGVVKLLPPTGVPLPFISYGGTFLVVSFISLGIIFGLFKWSEAQNEVARSRRRNTGSRFSAEADY